MNGNRVFVVFQFHRKGVHEPSKTAHGHPCFSLVLNLFMRLICLSG
jgi:hypothetical protein